MFALNLCYIDLGISSLALYEMGTIFLAYNYVFVYIIVWSAVVLGINGTSNAGSNFTGEAECNFLHYKCY